MRTLRSITGYTLYDHKRSEKIRESCEMQDVVSNMGNQSINHALLSKNVTFYGQSLARDISV